MNKDAKRINPSLRNQVENVKSHIRCNNGSGFDGGGYVFKTAVREMKKELARTGQTIKYNSDECSYFVVNMPTQLEIFAS